MIYACMYLIGYFHKLRIEVKTYERFKVYTSDSDNRTKNEKFLHLIIDFQNRTF